jgi:hypothetical protein
MLVPVPDQRPVDVFDLSPDCHLCLKLSGLRLAVRIALLKWPAGGYER